MEIDEAIKKRRSIRKYKHIPVEWEKIVAILDAGRRAPSSGNLQNWRFIVVTEHSKKKELAAICHNQSWIAFAPVCIIVCSNTFKVTTFYHDRGLLYAIMNCSAAAENMLLKATDLGLGSCWVSSFDDKALKEKFNIPNDSDPFVILTFGYSDEEVPEPPREELYSIVFLEKYGNRIKDIDKVLKDYGKKHLASYQKAADTIKEGTTNVFDVLKSKIKKR